MMKTLRTAVFLSLWLTRLMGSPNQKTASSSMVESFDVQNTRALQLFRILAEKEHIVIGVSGTLVGSDHTLISISLSHTTIREVLNTITAKDPRYAWRDMPGDTIEVTIGQTPLPILSVFVHNWSLDRSSRYEVTSKLANLKEIKDWLQSQACSVSEFFMGTPPSEVVEIKANIPDEEFRGVLNEIASQTGTYFWSAIKYSASPCAINLVP